MTGPLAQRAAALDAADPLAAYTTAFIRDGDVISYLDGNSLGRPLCSLPQRLQRFVEQDWGVRLIRGWDEGWMNRPYDLGDRIGRLVGAAGGQTFIGDSTTVLLYKLMRAAVNDRPGRTEIVIDDDNFPTDRFIAEGIAAERGLKMRWIEADRSTGVTPDQVTATVSERTALVVLSHVAFRSGYIADMAVITRVVHDAGALMLWDLCHSVGALPVELDACAADLAVGCTYKYLNGGPGSPAFAYVREHLQGSLRQPIEGWMGAADVFAMGPRYEPASHVRRFASGTPPILATVALEAMVELLEEVGMEAVRQKSIALTDFTEQALADYVLPLGARLASPPAGPTRGSHLVVTHPAFREITPRLLAQGVIPDFRAPDGMRIGLSPLSTTFAEVELGIAALGAELRTVLNTQS